MASGCSESEEMAKGEPWLARRRRVPSVVGEAARKTMY